MVIVSVIVPIYNREQTIIRCVKSIIDQSYKDIEIILIDDGSTDRCGEICDEFVALDNRVTVIHQSNKGVSAARNAGLESSVGDYVMFVDSDDMIVENAVEVLVQYSLKYHADLVSTKYELVDLPLKHLPSNTLFDDELFSSNYLFVNEFLIKCPTVLNGPCGKIYKNDLIKTNKLKFPENLSFGEDMLFNFDFFFYCTKIFVSAKTVHLAIASEGSLSRSHHNNMMGIFLLHFNKKKDFFIKIGEYNEESRKKLCSLTFYWLIDAIISEVANGLKYNELKKYLDGFFANDDVKEILQNTVPYNSIGRFQKICIETKNTFLIYCLVKLKQRVRKNLSKS